LTGCERDSASKGYRARSLTHLRAGWLL